RTPWQLRPHGHRPRKRRQDHADGDPAGGGAGPMSATPSRPVDSSWRRSLLTAAGCAVFGVLVHFAGAIVPVELATVGLGIGVIGAAFLLAWAADAGEAVF